eukprot:scaffold4668_cov267-Chaetoceros_neogracile.AAC.3
MDRVRRFKSVSSRSRVWISVLASSLFKVLCGEFLLEGAGFGLELEVLLLALLLEYQGFLLLLLEGLLEGSGCGLEGLDGLLVLELLGFGLGVVEEALVELSLDGFFVEVVVVDSGVVVVAAVAGGIGLEIDSSSEVTAAMMERKRINLIADMKIIVRMGMGMAVDGAGGGVLKVRTVVR